MENDRLARALQEEGKGELPMEINLGDLCETVSALGIEIRNVELIRIFGHVDVLVLRDDNDNYP